MTTRRNFLTAMAAAPLAFGAAQTVRQTALGAEAPSAAGRAKPMSFRDGKFRVLQLTDLHLGYNCADGMKRAETTLNIVRDAIAASSPDLVVYTGDIVWLDPTELSGGLAEGWARAVAPMEEAKIPFVVTLGNHDHERKEPAKEIFAAIAKSEYNLTCDVASLPGAGNCYLPILDADGKERRRLWFFDSHAYPFRGGLGTYDWIKAPQIEWYRDESARAAAENGAPVPGVAFFHIPLPEYWKVYKTKETVGTQIEDPCSPELNSGLFTAFIERGDVEGVFVGHDHNDDFIGVYKGIALSYGRKTGVEVYGDLPKGGRVIDFTADSAGFVTYTYSKEKGKVDEYAFKK